MDNDSSYNTLTNEYLKRVYDKAPWFGAKKYAIHGTKCLWWSSFPEDISRTETGIPCCPYCGGALAEVELYQFLLEAENDPGLYGKGGLNTFLKAHHRYNEERPATCRTSWQRYEVKIKNSVNQLPGS